MTDLPTILADLKLLGLTLVHRTEECPHALCHALDWQYDVDLVAADSSGKPVFVAHRRQVKYEYRGLSIRSQNDRGNEDVQLAKLMDGRSRADLYVQSYPGWVASAPAAAIRSAVIGLQIFGCPVHPYDRSGDQGQRLVPICEACCPQIEIHLRQLTTVAA